MSLIWMDSWQMQCCGKPGEVGDDVLWMVGPPDLEWLLTVLDEKTASLVTGYEDHHGVVAETDGRNVTGTIRLIRAVHRPGSSQSGRDAARAVGKSKPTWVHSSDGREPCSNGLELAGYLVTIESS